MSGKPVITAIALQFIISGQPTILKAKLRESLGNAVKIALAESGNTGRPAADWQLRDGNGVLLDLNLQVEEYRFKPGSRLFLNPAVGAGGARATESVVDTW